MSDRVYEEDDLSSMAVALCAARRQVSASQPIAAHEETEIATALLAAYDEGVRDRERLKRVALARLDHLRRLWTCPDRAGTGGQASAM